MVRFELILKATWVAVLLVASPALARGLGGRDPGGRYRGGYWNGNHFGGGYPLWAPSTYGPYGAPDYPAGSTAYPVRPEVYIGKNADPGIQPLNAGAWDYCRTTDGYYPYVKECPAGWERLAPQPAGQSGGYWYYCRKPAGYYPYVRTCETWQKLIP